MPLAFLLSLFPKTDFLPKQIQTLLLSIDYKTSCHTDHRTGLNYKKTCTLLPL